MAGMLKRITDRFKPGVFDRLKQSKEAKAATKEKLAKPEVSFRPPIPGAQLESFHRAVDYGGNVHNETVWRAWHMDTETMGTQTSCGDCNNQVWVHWNSRIDVTNSATTSNVWYDWNRQSQVTVGSTNTIRIWESWMNDEQPRRLINSGGIGRVVETPEQRRIRDAKEAEYRQQRAAQDAAYAEQQRIAANKRKDAEDRAMKLLVSMLNAEQQADLKRDNHFFVNAPSGRLYRIDYGTHGNVKVVDRYTKKIIERLCIQPNGVPAGDANLMQKLLIETAEEHFRAHANITLENGNVVHGVGGQLDNVRLAEVIPIRRAA